MTDPYKVLGVSKTATEAEIKKAYKTLCGKHHPDKGGDEAKFKEVQAAYSKLTEPEKHDSFSSRYQNQGGFNFNSFQQIKVKVELTLEEAFTGVNKIIFVKQISQNVNCNFYAGTQHLSESQFTIQKDGVIYIINFWCSIIKHSIFSLDGKDLKIRKTLSLLDFYKDNEILITGIDGKDVKLKVLANSNPGTQLRLKGQGFISNGVRGNLIVTINVELPILTQEQFVKLGELINESN